MVSLHTSPLAPLGRTRDAGGMNVYIRGLARELGREGMYVDIFTRRSHAETPTIEQLGERIRLIHLSAGPAIPLAPSELFPYVGEFSRRMARFAEEDAQARHGYDMLHTHYWLSAAAALPLARAWDVPHVTMFHTVERLKGRQGVTTAGFAGGDVTLGFAGADVAPLEQWSEAQLTRIEHEARIAAQVDRIIVSTEHEGEQLRRLYGLLASRTIVIPCGVDLRAFTPGGADCDSAPRWPDTAARDVGECPDPALLARARDEARRLVVARHALTSDPILLFVGRLDPIKGIDLLLESAAQLRRPAQVIVVGGDPTRPGGDPEITRLRARADELGIADRVRFPGAIAQDDLPTYYRAAEALVVTSRYESFGLVAVEALACGTPVIASRVGGLPSIVREGENGLLASWRSPSAFAARIDELLADDALRARLRAQARHSVERLDWRRIGDRVRALYGALTAAHRCAAACSCF